MKIRLGFVSNSSSASYVVTLAKTFKSRDELLVDIYDTCWCAIQEQETAYFERQEELDRRFPKDPNPTTIINSIFDSLPESEPRVRRHTRIESENGNFIDSNAEKVSATEYMLSQEGILINEVEPGKYTLEYFTSMHNSFNDMNDLLKCIYFEYLLEQGGAKITWENDD
jgi:hypothetical protein